MGFTATISYHQIIIVIDTQTDSLIYMLQTNLISRNKEDASLWLAYTWLKISV